MPYLFLFFALTFLACSGDDDASDDGSNQNRSPAYYKELKHNYALLKNYFYHPERLEENAYSYYGLEIDEMYETLHDTLKGGRYTRYYPPEIGQQVINDTENSERNLLFGFVRVPNSAMDTFIVSAVYPNSPAQEGGLKKRDKLLFANDVPLTGEAAIASPPVFDEITVFTVLRGEEIVTLDTMQKRELQSPTVFLDSLDGVPLIAVTEFTRHTSNPDGTHKEFQSALQEIRGAKTAIVDLRNNPGGSIYHCMAMAAELVPPEKMLVYDIVHGKNKAPDYSKDYTEREGYGVGIKWVLMVNGRSASCSERFAAAVTYNRPETIVVGQTTFGKGIGQYYMETNLGGAAFITGLETFYPDGKPLHRVGVSPSPGWEASGEEIEEKALEAAQSFGVGLAKRAPVVLKERLPKRSPSKKEPGAYKKILFH